MRARLLGLACLMLMAVAVPQTAQACTCVPTTPEEQRASADAVFIGFVSSVSPYEAEPDELGHTWGNISASLAVGQVFKGRVDQITDVVTRDQGATCGFPFEVGGEVLVFASGSPLQTNLCAGRGQVSAADGWVPLYTYPRAVPSATPDLDNFDAVADSRTVPLAIAGALTLLSILALRTRKRFFAQRPE